MTTLVIATRNAHKIAEIRRILPERMRILSQLDFPNAPSVAEDADTFAGNAAKKAEGLFAWLSAADNSPATLDGPFFVLADDSGLEVDALGGAPGVHSARFAAADTRGTENSSDAANNAKLLRSLAGVPPEKRTARFRCCLALKALARPTVLFEGICEGRVALVSGGTGGFGYDPFFIPEGYSQSFAELGDSVKNSVSHRARALSQVRRFLEGPA